MAVTIRQIHPLFVGEVDGVDLSRPLSPEDVAALDAGINKYAVLVFHDQKITDEQQVAFTRNFGEIELAVGSNVTKPENRRIPVELADVSNLSKDQKLLEKDDRQRMFNLGNRLWHSDSSFRWTPSKYSLLSGRVIPSAGGNTEFADMRSAYDALDDDTKTKIEDLICEHSLIHSRALLGFTELSEEEKKTFAPVQQRLVRRHPQTGRRSLFLSSHIGTILGWLVPEARAFVRDLMEHATQRQFVHAHVWRQWDLVWWDNRQTMHRVRPFKDNDEVRDVRRTTVAGEAPTVMRAVA